MIFAIHDWGCSDPAKSFPNHVKKMTAEWTEKKGTKKNPVIEPRKAEIFYVEFDTLEQLLDFMQANKVIVQIRLPHTDAEGHGFPHYRLFTDTPSGQFHQR